MTNFMRRSVLQKNFLSTSWLASSW